VLRYIAEWTKGQGTSYGLTTHLIHSAQSAKIFGATIADKVLFVKPPLVVPWHAKVVIIAAVVISMTTTYLTVRQSMKRGMMPTGSDSPMGQSQKLMAYIMPLFALTGLYWQFGLVLYWVTTNVWTLGQQFLLLRRYPVGAAAMGPNGNVPISGGKPATASGLVSRPAKPKPGTSQPGSSKTGNTTGTGKAAPSGKTGPGSKQVSTTKPAGKPAAQNSNDTSSKNTSGKNTSSGASSASGQQPAARAPADGSSNGHKPGGSDGGMLRRFGRKAEPEPVPEPEPQTKIVRQQRARQSRSKRSGKR
jgi:hypothetical protein